MEGAEEPAPSLAALRAAVYRPGAGDAEVAALERALALLPEDRGSTLAPPEEPPLPGRPSVPAERRRPWLRPLVALAAGLAGAVAGALLVTQAGPAGTRSDVPTIVHVTATATTAVFDRPQRPSDRPGVALDPALQPGSLRGLLTAGRFRVYGALDRSGRICLVAPQDAAATTCADSGRFRRDGLLLLLSTDLVTVDPVGLRLSRSRLTLAASWAPNGAVTLGAVGP